MTEQQPDNMSKEEKIGFHKGALSTLAKERQELGRILQIVEEIMKMHVAALKEEGIDLQAEAEKMAGANPDADKNNKKPPIDELI